MSGDRGPVPEPAPPFCLVMLPAAVVLTAVAVLRHVLTRPGGRGAPGRLAAAGLEGPAAVNPT